jgi:DNA-binding MarR family transcriptional regulator
MRLGELIKQISTQFEKRLEQFREGSEKRSGLASLTLPQFQYLSAIASMNRPTFKDLSIHFGVTPPSVTAIISRLIEFGFLRRVQGCCDRRSHNLVLTKKGEEAIRADLYAYEKLAEEIGDVLNKEELELYTRLNQKLCSIFCGDAGS